MTMINALLFVAMLDTTPVTKKTSIFIRSKSNTDTMLKIGATSDNAGYGMLPLGQHVYRSSKIDTTPRTKITVDELQVTIRLPLLV